MDDNVPPVTPIYRTVVASSRSEPTVVLTPRPEPPAPPAPRPRPRPRENARPASAPATAPASVGANATVTAPAIVTATAAAPETTPVAAGVPQPPPVATTPDPPRSAGGFKNVPLEALEALRVGGRRAPALPDAVLVTARAEHVGVLAMTEAMCVGPDGAPASVELIARSGDRAADDHVVAELRAWRFRPYLVGDRPIRVCTTNSTVRTFTLAGARLVEGEPIPLPGGSWPAGLALDRGERRL